MLGVFVSLRDDKINYILDPSIGWPGTINDTTVADHLSHHLGIELTAEFIFYYFKTLRGQAYIPKFY